MKTIIIQISLLLFIGSYKISAANSKPAALPAPASFTFQLFYDGLSPYGSWVSYSSYGYVWIPRVSAGFVPYASGGHWEYTLEYGWLWVSDYPWGWAPFHYGRWYYDDFYGWLWVPGYHWGPAWVTWGYYGAYYGWAPLGPGINFSAGYMPPAHYWCFVPRVNITSVNVVSYRVSNSTIIQNKVTVLNDTKTYSGATFASGPRIADVEKTSGRKITPVSVADSKSAGATRISGKQVAVYRPAITKEGTSKAAPAKVEKLENMPRAGKSSAANQQFQKPAVQKPENRQQPAREKIGEPRKVPESERQPVNKPEQKREPVRAEPKHQPNKQPERPREKLFEPGQPQMHQPRQMERQSIPQKHQMNSPERRQMEPRQSPPPMPKQPGGGGRGKPK